MAVAAERKLTQQEELELFRKALEDAATVAEKLSGVCGSVTELVEVVRLAQGNDAQLRLLYKEIIQGKR